MGYDTQTFVVKVKHPGVGVRFLELEIQAALSQPEDNDKWHDVQVMAI